MPILAQVPVPAGEETSEAPEVTPVEVERPGEQWDELVEFWSGLEWTSIGVRIWEHFQTAAFWIDSGAVVACIALAWMISRFLRNREGLSDWYPIVLVRERLAHGKRFPLFLLVFAVLLWTAVVAAGLLGYTCPILRGVTILYTAFAAIQLPSLLAPGKFWVKPFASVVIVATVLHMFGLLEAVIDLLQRWGIHIGDVRITPLTLIVGPTVFLVAYGIGKLIVGFIDRRMTRSRTVPATVRVLTGKVLQFTMLLVAIGVTLTAVGINFTAITVFGGALGLGVGFGLQKVVSNLISGVIILLDKSIKPGDVIEIGDTWGVINGLRTRYVSVMTRDKKEILIPNEDFITQPVVNWSFSDKLVRYRVPIGVSYESNVREAIRLAEEAASSRERVCPDPAPSCRMRGFGDSAINLELRFWVLDPGEGRGNIISDVLLAIWDAYQENAIEIPFPQTELRLRGDGEAIREVVLREEPDAD